MKRTASLVLEPEPHRTGRFTKEQRESQTPAGRSVHWLESRLADFHRLLARFFGHHERETLIDAELDGKVRLAVLHLDDGNGIEARALLLEFLERDALRDAEHHAQHGLAVAMHAAVKRIGAALERAAVQIRGGR